MRREKGIQAVLTGDIVNSTRMTMGTAAALVHRLEQLFAGSVYEFYRGDAFQVFLPMAGNALSLALRCRCIAIAAADPAAGGPGDVRIGIGLGDAERPEGRPGLARDEAFVLSGRGFDSLAETGERLILQAAEEWPSLALSILSAQLNGLFSTLTPRQAEAIDAMLEGKTGKETAGKLGKSASTIHQHLVAGGWPAIEKALQHYRQIVERINQ